MTADPLVSVVVPAFNAGATLRETLASIAAQTHRELEIIVVDDGSTDDTAEIAEGFAKADPRFRLLRQPNLGVAAARNTGIRASSAAYIAFIDADDLWHPSKTAKQLALLLASGAETALVYSPFRQIDAKGMVYGASRNHRVDGWVANRHFYVNVVGNGSSILIRKRVLEEIGGFSSLLHELDAQGSEDLLLQLQVALRYRFATVPEYLVGYRQSLHGLSSHEERMLRSTLLSLKVALAEYPELIGFEDSGMFGQKLWEYLKFMALHGRIGRGLAFVLPFLQGRAGLVAGAALKDGAHKFKRLWQVTLAFPAGLLRPKPAITLRHFYDYDPCDPNYADHLPASPEMERRDAVYATLLALAPLDAAYNPDRYLTKTDPPRRGQEFGRLRNPRNETA